jgi:HAMP domain-containing protein/DNA-directed RNA polymerase subunit M/transcription elongation factor TFIIS
MIEKKDISDSRVKIECKVCRQRYNIPVKYIRKKNIKFNCKKCGASFKLRKSNKPEMRTQEVQSDRKKIVGQDRKKVEYNPIDKIMAPIINDALVQPYTPTNERLANKFSKASVPNDRLVADAANTSSPYYFGLTTKFLIFTLTPLIIISIISILFSINKMFTYQNATIAQSTAIVKKVNEEMLSQLAKTVSQQTRQYLFSHPDLKHKDFNRDINFKKVAIQRVGLTGITSLYEIADKDGVWRVWTDADAKLVGKDLSHFKNKLGKYFNGYWELKTGVKDGKIVSGYYQWPDDNGIFREKYMVCVPVEGTRYAVTASIYLDEITFPLIKIYENGNILAAEMRNSNVAIMGGGMLFIALIIYFYGCRQTAKIFTLAQWADRISLGELELKKRPINSKDELGELCESIARMQASIRLSIKRLRYQRDSKKMSHKF